MDWTRYKTIVAEFDALHGYAMQVSSALIGQTVVEAHRQYANQIFVKLLAHGLSLRRLSPDPSQRSQQELWDLSSTSAIARSLIEAYDALVYVSGVDVDARELEFRLRLWELHDVSRRARMLEHIGSKDPRLAQVQTSAAALKVAVMNHECFKSLTRNLQKRIEDGDPPPYRNTQRRRCQEGKIDFDYYNAITMQLSQYVHTFPFAVDQLFRFRAGGYEELRKMSLPLQYSLPFVAQATNTLRSLFPGVATDPSQSVQVSALSWSTIAQRGVKNEN